MTAALAKVRRGTSWVLFGEMDLPERLAAIDTSLGDKGLAGQVARLEQDVQAVLRRLALPTDPLPFPSRLTAQRFRGWSQNEEDGITLALMNEMAVRGRGGSWRSAAATTAGTRAFSRSSAAGPG